MARIRIDPTQIKNGLLLIRDPQTLHYLGNVLRLKQGGAVECFDGLGGKYAAVILESGKEAWELSLQPSETVNPEKTSIVLVQALIRPERFEWVIEKATELGVSQIIPAVTHRTRARPVAGRETARLKRWQRIAESAAAQCGRSAVPSIEAPQLLEEALPKLPSPAFIPTLDERTFLFSDRLKRCTCLEKAAVVIGPEGDFTSDELDLAKESGIQPVSLGPVALRAETAAVVCLAILRQRMGLL